MRFVQRRSASTLAGLSFILILFVACAPDAKTDNTNPGDELAGQVTRVVDGDTIELTDSTGVLTKVRLSQIDAPEKAQPYGAQATEALSNLVLGKTVRAQVVDVDRYGRSVCEIYAGGLYVNFEMVRLGHAWAYTKYIKALEIVDLENEARKHARGLWKLHVSERDAPWVWRAERRKSNTKSKQKTGTGDTRCGAKRTCKEMESCREARFYLTQCGLKRLDGDGDGTPCESMCAP